MELTERKKKVLRSVVDLYIRTAEPVGSKAITELPDMNYSSATIRNELVAGASRPSPASLCSATSPRGRGKDEAIRYRA